MKVKVKEFHTDYAKFEIRILYKDVEVENEEQLNNIIKHNSFADIELSKLLQTDINYKKFKVIEEN